MTLDSIGTSLDLMWLEVESIGEGVSDAIMEMVFRQGLSLVHVGNYRCSCFSFFVPSVALEIKETVEKLEGYRAKVSGIEA